MIPCRRCLQNMTNTIGMKQLSHHIDGDSGTGFSYVLLSGTGRGSFTFLLREGGGAKLTSTHCSNLPIVSCSVSSRSSVRSSSSNVW